MVAIRAEGTLGGAVASGILQPIHVGDDGHIVYDVVCEGFMEMSNRTDAFFITGICDTLEDGRELDRHFAIGKAMSRGMVNGLAFPERLDTARFFCKTALEAYWNAKTTEAGVGWSVSPISLHEKPLDPMVQDLAWELGQTAARFEPVKAGYLLGTLYTATLPADLRSKLGAFYTPTPYVNRLLDLVEELGFDWSTGKVIDPACGGGAFLAPVALRMARACNAASEEIQLASITSRLEGVEIDPFAAWMSHVLLEAALLPLCVKAGKRLPLLIQTKDALELERESEFDLVIGNPPYGRIRLPEAMRRKFSRSLYGHANLYGVFTDLAVRLAKAGGLVAFVSPASFLAGQYFKELRKVLMDNAPPRRINFIEDREGVFEDVLQETLLGVYQKRKAGANGASVDIDVLSPEKGGQSIRIHAVGKARLEKGGCPWLLPRTSHQAQAFENLDRLKNNLALLGYEISTGPLVWNRHKDQLRQEKSSANSFPIIWAESVSSKGFRFSASRRNHIPYIELKEHQEHLLVCSPCVLVQRTTAKEQQKRLIAAVLPASFIAEHGAVVVENHLNMIYPKGEPEISLQTIALLLNSKTVDNIFRCLSGSVAVSAYELNALPLPDMKELKSLDRLICQGAEPALIEKRLNRIYGVGA